MHYDEQRLAQDEINKCLAANSAYFVIVPTWALRAAGLHMLCGDGYLTGVNRSWLTGRIC
jgi:hypothetical protein